MNKLVILINVIACCLIIQAAINTYMLLDDNDKILAAIEACGE